MESNSNDCGKGGLRPGRAVTAANMSRYRRYLAPGYRELFRKYPDFKMIVYPSRRTVSYPQAIYKATQTNIGRAHLAGPDALLGARLGFPFPRPDNGVQVMWNHRVRYRGGSIKVHSTQAVVHPDGDRDDLHQTELLYSRYANIADPVNIAKHNILLDYLTWFEKPGGGFDFAALMHEYDHDGHLWRFQEGHLLPFYGVQAASCAPVVTYDFKTGTYFVNHLIGHEPIPEFHLENLSPRDFLPSTVRARFGR